MNFTQYETELLDRLLNEVLDGMNSGWIEGSLSESDAIKSILSKLNTEKGI